MGADLYFLSKQLQEKRSPILENIAYEVRKLPQAKKEPLKTLLVELDKLEIK